jgi:DNA-binding FadR family transcriptional regulator
LPEHHSSSRATSRRNLYDQIARTIGTDILSGKIKPGEMLLGESAHGVSRTAMREAIKILIAKGLIEALPKRGTWVRRRELWNMLDPDVMGWWVAVTPFDTVVRGLFELRQLVEPGAAAIAAERGSPEAIADIEAAYQGMAVSVAQIESSIRTDILFHQAILKATGNELVFPFAAVIEITLMSSFRVPRPKTRVASLAHHRSVLDAIKARNPEAARRTMQYLLTAAFVEVNEMLGAKKTTQTQDKQGLAATKKGSNIQ